MRAHNKGQGLARDGEVPAQVGQGRLAHLAVLDEALREPSLAVPVLVARMNMAALQGSGKATQDHGAKRWHCNGHPGATPHPAHTPPHCCHPTVRKRHSSQEPQNQPNHPSSVGKTLKMG